MRDKHCSFMVDNGRGRCIADCHYNLTSDGIDCTGASGPTMNQAGHHEVPISAGFIDGTYKEVKHNHEDGTYTVVDIYKPPAPLASNKVANLLTLPYQTGRVYP